MLLKRKITPALKSAISAGKNVLLLGPRQTGKTTLLSTLESDLSLNLALPRVRQELEKDPERLIQMIDAIRGGRSQSKPLVIIDEIQKVPTLTDVIQVLIDGKKAQFILTGSSARKLKRHAQANLLPGRVLQFRMDPLSHEEWPNQPLEQYLLNGSLPGIAPLKDKGLMEQELTSYVEIYLEEEVRSEAIVRNLPAFYRFLELAAVESGRIFSANAIAQELGIAQTTVQAYLEVLEDCLILERVEPLTKSASRKKLAKSPRYLFYDMGVRRVAAHEGERLSPERMGELFEHWIGLELIRHFRQSRPKPVLHYWRDPDGPEVDWVIESEGRYLPIEVKYKDSPANKDIRHLKTFLKEYPCPWGALLVCRSSHALQLEPGIVAVPWREFFRRVMRTVS